MHRNRTMIAVAATAASALLAACSGGATTQTSAAGATTQTSATGASSAQAAATPLDGVYRFETTEQNNRKAGEKADQAYDDAGVWTWTLGRGTWCFEQKATHPVDGPNQCGRLEVQRDGATLVLVMDDGGRFEFAVRRDANRSLLLSPVNVAEMKAYDPVGAVPFATMLSSVPWTRVGDLS